MSTIDVVSHPTVGKGDRPRPYNPEKWDSEWSRIFGKKRKKGVPAPEQEKKSRERSKNT